MKKIEHLLIDLDKNKGWLAKEAKIAPGTLSNILKGATPTLPVALRIAKVLGTTVEDLWGHLIQ
ncbi:helix-turn-helix transcriptional regulator [Anaerobacillus sp. MEB173]|uniref:helix-turn-helix transcriptional regulator n=1 Tax=Anaerobacillus sp. MEB173 TaxID=3383345 RepID=UPI003F9101E1